MESIPRILPEQPTDERQRLFDIFFDIEKKARLSGRADVLVRLDRVSDLMLGPTNRVSEGAESAAISNAYVALEHILNELERQSATQTS